MHDAFTTAGLSLSSVFVPFSKSRNKAEKHASLNWLVTLQRNGRDILTTDYMAGSAHCPAYKLSVKEAGGRNSIMRDGMIRIECETGRTHETFGQGAPILPDADSVISCLLNECDVLDAGTFESWADEFGYDRDSRKAEAIYNACLKTALALRAALGGELLESLREVAREF